MNVITRLEFEPAYFDSKVHRFNHYTTKTPLVMFYIMQTFVGYMIPSPLYTYKLSNTGCLNIHGMWPLLTLLIIMLCSVLFQIWNYYSLKPINRRLQWLGYEREIFCVTTYLETKSLKTVQAKFCKNFNFDNYPKKSQIYYWVHEFQATGPVNNLNKKV